MQCSASDRPTARLAAVAAVYVLTLAAPAATQAQEPASARRIVSSEISVSRREATLRLELGDGQKIDLALRDGAAFSAGRPIGEAPRGGAVDNAWRELLNQAIDAPTDELARMLVRWNAPDSELGRRIDATLEAALSGGPMPALAPEAPEPAVVAEAVGAAVQEAVEAHVNDSLQERINELEQLVEDLEDRRDDARIRAAPAGRGFDWLGPFRNIARGLAGILSILVTYAVLFGIGFVTIFFGGRRYIEGVADTARHFTTRSLLVGLAATFLLIPAFILGIIALAISIIGIPALLVWIPLFPVATAVAILLGYIGVAHAAGEAFAERRFYVNDWFQRGNSYYFMLTGLALLMGLFIAAQIVSMAGPWLGFFRGALTALGVVITWATLSIGLGAVLISRGGTRPVRGASAPEPEIFAEPTHA